MRVHRTHPSTVSLAFPLSYARARTVRAERLARRRRATSERFDAVLDRELATGAIPSLSRVAVSLGVSYATLAAYSPERCAQIVALRESSYSTREVGLAERVRAALLAALDEPEGPTVGEVARSVSVGEFVVLSVCPDEYHQLVDMRYRERKARHARYAAAMREDLARRRPHGVTFVAARLGVYHATLRRADPALYAKLCALPSDRAAASRQRRESAARARADALRTRRSQLREAVDRELRSSTPRSPRAVALECGVPPSVLRHHCPDQYRRLLDVRRTVRSKFLETVRRALEAEIFVPSPRSPSAFAIDLGVAGRTLETSFPSLVAELRAAVERAPRRPLPRRPRPGDFRILAALEAEARSSSRRSVRALSRALGVSPSTLSRVSRDAVERLVAARAQHRRRHDPRLTALIVPALQAELQSKAPRSANAVARQLGLFNSELARLAPILYRQLVDRRRRSE